MHKYAEGPNQPLTERGPAGTQAMKNTYCEKICTYFQGSWKSSKKKTFFLERYSPVVSAVIRNFRN